MICSTRAVKGLALVVHSGNAIPVEACSVAGSTDGPLVRAKYDREMRDPADNDL